MKNTFVALLTWLLYVVLGMIGVFFIITLLPAILFVIACAIFFVCVVYALLLVE